MTNVDEAISKGHYARKQLFCKDRLISWSHRSRFQMGVELARKYSGKRVLDYGCGDGTFLAMLMADSAAPQAAVGVEAHSVLIEDCRAGCPIIKTLALFLPTSLMLRGTCALMTRSSAWRC